ncbi:MAG TPA: MarR family transcriptional regulator [Novosphingobium sp.]|nr:MarR family transcriptional regulator [Novosphingobium sp.]
MTNPDAAQPAEAAPASEDHKAGSLDLRLWIRLLGSAKLIEKRLRRNLQDQFGTTLPRFDVLATLERTGQGMTMGALSRALLVSNGNVTSIVRQLHESGMVAVVADPDDRRSAIVSLTPHGRAQFAIYARAHRGWVQEALAGFAPARQRQLFELLGALRATLRAQDGD